MAKTRVLGIDERAKIDVLRSTGLSMSQIAGVIGCSKSTVKRTIDKKREIGNLNKTQCVVPRKLTRSDEKYLMLCSKRDRRKTLPEIAREFNLSHQTKVGLSTIRRSLLRSGMSGRVAAKKPFLRKINIAKRLKFAKDHVNWTQEQWDRVLFTDESKFELFGCKRRVFVRRMEHERFARNCIVGTVKHGGGSVMVWGGVCSQGVVPLVQIQGIMKKEQYHTLLYRHALPGGKKLLGRGFVFQQDNDPKHTAKVNLKYLDNKEKTGKSCSLKK
jgi:transposase